MQLIQASFGDNNIMYMKKISWIWQAEINVGLINFSEHIAKTKKL